MKTLILITYKIMKTMFFIPFIITQLIFNNLKQTSSEVFEILTKSIQETFRPLLFLLSYVSIYSIIIKFISYIK
jgi:hypothetical protein